MKPGKDISWYHPILQKYLFFTNAIEGIPDFSFCELSEEKSKITNNPFEFCQEQLHKMTRKMKK